MKIKSKYFLEIITAFLSFGLIATIITPIIISKNNHLNYTGDISNINKNIINYKIKLNFNGVNYNDQNYKNAIYEDSKQKSKSNNTSVYVIGKNNGVFHKYGMTTHILSTLQLNKNKKIIVFTTNKSLDFNVLNNSNFPNFKVININSEGRFDNLSDLDLYDQNFIDQMNSLNDFDFYCEYYFILNNIYAEIKNSLKSFDKNEILNKYMFLYRSNSINMFSDGTLGNIRYYDNSIYFLLEQLKCINNPKTNIVEKVEEKYNYFHQMAIDKKEVNFYDDNNFYWFYLSLVISSKKGNDITKTKYFQSSCQLINDTNAPDSYNLTFSKENGEFFDPYNSLNSGIMELCKNFSSEYISYLLAIFKKENFDPQYWKNKFLNYDNYIYFGTILDTDERIEAEANKIIKIYENAINNGSNTENLKIYFKGHPRDKLTLDEMKNTLLNEIQKINPNLDLSNILSIMDNSIPAEIYLTSGCFNSDQQKTKIHLIIGYSTLAAFIYDYDNGNMIESFYLSKNDINEITKNFGKNSKVFDSKKWAET